MFALHMTAKTLNFATKMLLPMLNSLACILLFLMALLPTGAAGRGRMLTGRQLSGTYVNQIMQDSRGFVWIASRGGLDRCDGGRVMSWHRGVLPSDHVTCLTEDMDGRVIAGTTYGAVAYDYSSGSFTRLFTAFENDTIDVRVTSLTAMPNGDVILTAAGLGIYRLLRGETVAQHTKVYFDGGGDLVSSAFAPALNLLWFGGSTGVYSVDRDGKVKAYLADEGTGLCRVAVTTGGRVVAGTANRGLYVYDALSDRFVPHPASLGRSIVSLCAMDDGSVVVGTNGSGAWMLRHGADVPEPCAFAYPNVDFSRANVACMMQDRSGALWMGVSQKGVFMQPMAAAEAFRTIDLQACVMSVAGDADGTLWVGTDGDGLYRIDARTGDVLRHYAAGENGMPAIVMALEADAADRVWIGSWQQGGGWIDREKGTFHPFPFVERDGVENVMGLAADAQHTLWVATGGKGLYRYETSTGEDTHFEVKAGATPQTNSLSNHWPSELLPAADGRLLYFCMSAGLGCYDVRHQSFVAQFERNHVLTSFMVNTMRIDNKGRLWAGTDNGLLCLDSRGNTLAHFTIADGLPHNNVASLQFDKNGQLWIGTMKGLARMNRDSTFSVYVAADGLQDGEWGDRVACALGDLIVMGGTGGLSVIDPSALSSLAVAMPAVQLVEAVIDQQQVVPGGVFTMDHDAGSLSLRFSAMIYDRPEAVSYLYSINGAEYLPMVSHEGVLTLSHLASGSYTVSVKAVVGGEESEPVKVEVRVLPPFWRSWKAILLYIALAALVAWRLVVNRRNRLQHRRDLEEHIAKEQRKEEKLQFFMSLNHEIRTPMTLIAAPLQQLMASDHDEVRQRLYGMMNNASQRILSIINQILDLRKMDRGLLELHTRPTCLAAMVRDVCAIFEAKAAEHRISLAVEDRTGGCEVWIDPSHFDKVIMNLLSNAFKFTPDGGNVKVTLERTDTEAIITVWDDRQGIAPENLNNVFERFFQEKNQTNLNTAGTGIGLNLARQLVQLHHGSIEAKAMPDAQSGCAFVVTLPLGDKHLSESEKAPLEQEQADALSANPKSTNPKSTGRHILIVEDEEDIRNYLVTELSPHYSVIACADGRQALSEALRCPPSLVLTDVMMPQMDGYTLCARLKANTATNFVPVVMLTAKTRESDKLEGLGQGADAYIEKPFNIDIVRHTIRNLIAAHDLLRNKLSGNELPLDSIDEVRIATPDEQLIERLTRVVNAHIDDPNLSVEQIAQEVGISRSHLHRKMKELTNLGPRDWVRNLRLERAAQMLRQGHHNIAQVMYACGFDNKASFSTKFKSKFGMSPTAYMQENNGR